MKIAICDDDKNELFHILSLLADYQIQKNTDFSYKPFESSMELATNAAEERYDIYLLDVVMPGLNGMELAKEIRSYDKAANIRSGKLHGESLQLSDKTHSEGSAFRCIGRYYENKD